MQIISRREAEMGQVAALKAGREQAEQFAGAWPCRELRHSTSAPVSAVGNRLTARALRTGHRVENREERLGSLRAVLRVGARF